MQKHSRSEVIDLVDSFRCLLIQWFVHAIVKHWIHIAICVAPTVDYFTIIVFMVKVAEVNQWLTIIIQTIQFCITKFIEDVGHLANEDDFINQLVLLRSYLSQLQGAIHHFNAICYDSGICSFIRIKICRNVSSRRIVSIADVYVIDLSKDGIIALCSWTLYCLGIFCLSFIRMPNVSNRVIE